MVAREDREASIVAPGNYDGAHRGHRALLDAARALGDRDGSPVVVLTFDPHPATVLAPARAPALLTTIERRVELLTAFGADAVEVLRFDHELAAEEPEDFVRRVLVEHLNARAVVIGPDFRFGRGASGDVTLLRTLGGGLGFSVHAHGPLEHDGAVISSTRVRRAIAAGAVEEACALLGRAHDVSGTVIRGDQRGRTIGVPTANLDPEPVLLPADGVYAVLAKIVGEDELLRGVANLGVRPTVGAGRSFEVHLFDFARDVYDRRVRISFVARLREERRFDGLDALKAQIKEDIRAAKVQLEAAPPETYEWI